MSQLLYLRGVDYTFNPLGADHPGSFHDSLPAQITAEEIRKGDQESWGFTYNSSTTWPPYNERKWADASAATYTLQINVTQTTSAMTTASGGHRYYTEDNAIGPSAAGWSPDLHPSFTTTGVKTVTWSGSGEWSANASGYVEGWDDCPAFSLAINNSDSKNNGTVEFGGSGGYGLTMPDPWGTPAAMPDTPGASTASSNQYGLVAPLSPGQVKVFFLAWLSTDDPTVIPSGWTTLESGTWGGGSYKYLLLGAHYDDFALNNPVQWGSSQTYFRGSTAVSNLPSSGWYDGAATYIYAWSGTHANNESKFPIGSASTDHGATVAFHAAGGDQTWGTPIFDYTTSAQTANSTTLSGWVGARAYSQNPTEGDDVFSLGIGSYQRLSIGIVLSQDGVSGGTKTADATSTATHGVTATATAISLVNATATDTHDVTVNLSHDDVIYADETDTHDVSANVDIVKTADSSATDVHTDTTAATVTDLAEASATDTHATTATTDLVNLLNASEADTHSVTAAVTVTDLAETSETDTHGVTASATVTDFAEADGSDVQTVTATVTVTDLASASEVDTHDATAIATVTDFASASETDTHHATADATTAAIQEADADETDTHAANVVATLETVVTATPTDTHVTTASETVIDEADVDATDVHVATASMSLDITAAASGTDTHAVAVSAGLEIGMGNEAISVTTITSGYDTDWTDSGTGTVTRNTGDIDVEVGDAENVRARSPQYTWADLSIPAGSRPTSLDIQYDVAVTGYVAGFTAAVEWQHGDGTWQTGTPDSIPSEGVTPSETLTEGFGDTFAIGALIEAV